MLLPQKNQKILIIADTTYHNPKLEKSIDDMVGKPFPFVRRIKMGGVGSGRQIIEDASDEIKKLLDMQNSTNYTNIELREKGIIIGFQSYLKNFQFIIPYRLLHIYKSKNYIGYYRESHFVKVLNDTSKSHQKFYRKVMKYKNEFLHHNSMP